MGGTLAKLGDRIHIDTHTDRQTDRQRARATKTTQAANDTHIDGGIALHKQTSYMYVVQFKIMTPKVYTVVWPEYSSAHTVLQQSTLNVAGSHEILPNCRASNFWPRRLL